MKFRAPQFYDEIKMQIPIDICDEHHILFTFYHIACKLAKGGGGVDTKQVQTAIAYTASSANAVLLACACSGCRCTKTVD